MKVKMILLLCICSAVASSCTLHFKASDVELQSVGNLTYELERFAIIENGEPAPD